MQYKAKQSKQSKDQKRAKDVGLEEPRYQHLTITWLRISYGSGKSNKSVNGWFSLLTVGRQNWLVVIIVCCYAAGAVFKQ